MRRNVYKERGKLKSKLGWEGRGRSDSPVSIVSAASYRNIPYRYGGRAKNGRHRTGPGPGTIRLREAIWSYVFVEARAFQVMSDASLFLLPFGHLAFSPLFSLPPSLSLSRRLRNRNRYDSARREPHNTVAEYRYSLEMAVLDFVPARRKVSVAKSRIIKTTDLLDKVRDGIIMGRY